MHEIFLITAQRIKIWRFVRKIVCKVIAAGMLQLWLRITFGFWDVSGRILLLLGFSSLHGRCCRDTCFPGKKAVHASPFLSIISYIYTLSLVITITYPLPRHFGVDDFPVPLGWDILPFLWTANIPSYSNLGWSLRCPGSASFHHFRDDALEWKNPLASRFFKVMDSIGFRWIRVFQEWKWGFHGWQPCVLSSLIYWLIGLKKMDFPRH